MGEHAGPAILVADDSRLVSELYRRLLQQYGAAVVTIANGSEALATGLETRFDLAILDQVMPGRVGVEVVQEWRAAGVTTPVIMVSGVRDERTRAEALAFGVDAYLFKPISGDDLIAEVNRILDATKPSPVS